MVSESPGTGQSMHDSPLEGSREHVATRKKLRRYWMDFGFREADWDYLYFEAA